MDRGQRDHSVALVGRRRPWLCVITGGLSGSLVEARATVLPSIIAAATAGADLIQIREKRLSGADLYQFCREARAATAPTGAVLVVNDRWDVAAAAGLDGVHLPSRGLPAAAVRRVARSGWIIGLSCHSPAEVHAAGSCDYCLLGPIFATPSKAGMGEPLGTAALTEAATAPVPVLALGGITVDRITACLNAGAAGVAGIRLFHPDPGTVAAHLARAAARR